MIPPALISVFKTMLAIQGALCFHTNFKIIFSSSVKSAFGILLRITLLGIALTVDCTGHFNKINSSNPRTQYMFPSICVILNFLHWCLIAVVPDLLVPGTGFIGNFSMDQGGRYGLRMIQAHYIIVHFISILWQPQDIFALTLGLGFTLL